MRQKDSLDSVRKAARDEEIRLIQLASSKEIEDLKSRLLTKSQELTACKAKASEFEDKTTQLNEGIQQQQKMIQSIHDEYKVASEFQVIFILCPLFLKHYTIE